MIDKQIVEQNAKDIGAQATLKQNMASDPNHNVWVGASAGTGKTKVLTDRVLRLLLPNEQGHDGAEPETILCITFTKAGANEMIARVMKVLSEWAVCSESELYKSLTKLLGYNAGIKHADRARELFATVIELPNGLNISTIHAFCQSLLGRFTLEANLPPNFTVMDDTESQAILRRVQDGILTDLIDGRLDVGLAKAVSVLSLYKNAEQWATLLKNIVQNRARIRTFIDGYQSVENASHSVFDMLNIALNEDEASVFASYFDDTNFPKDKILQMTKAFEFGSPTNKNQTVFLYDFCSRSFEEKKSVIQ
jgi:ATP-dependent helicase/nuclease subunit A